MNKYIGFKLIEAKPMNKYDFYMNVKGIDCKEENEEGYFIAYPDGYVSWSPKEVFEKAYLQINPNSKLTNSPISISQGMVNDFIKEYHVNTVGEKTTLVRAVLRNGFEIVEASSCVSKENYSEEIETEVCLDKIKDKVWYLLGFLLQTAANGIK